MKTNMGDGGGIIASGVSRSFGTVTAVKEATFEARPGKVTALIGPNGSGKTTLMLMLASLLQPDAGEISIAGFNPVTDAAAVRARLGWMPDVLGSWNALTVRATLEMTGRLYRMDREASAARTAELLPLVGLESLADQPTRVLSRGQKQKLSLGRALVHDPDVLLLDEPASGLDPNARVDLRQMVRRIAAEGKTVLVSSHVLAELDEMADTAVYLEAGTTASAESIARSRATSRLWRIKASNPTALQGVLVGAGIDPSDIGADRNELFVPLSGEDDAAALLARLVEAGIRVSTFAPAVGDLEHTFLDLNRPAALSPDHRSTSPASADSTNTYPAKDSDR